MTHLSRELLIKKYKECDSQQLKIQRLQEALEILSKPIGERFWRCEKCPTHRMFYKSSHAKGCDRHGDHYSKEVIVIDKDEWDKLQTLIAAKGE